MRLSYSLRIDIVEDSIGGDHNDIFVLDFVGSADRDSRMVSIQIPTELIGKVEAALLRLGCLDYRELPILCSSEYHESRVPDIGIVDLAFVVREGDHHQSATADLLVALPRVVDQLLGLSKIRARVCIGELLDTSDTRLL